MSETKRVVLGVTGSIAAYKSADLVRRLREKGLRVSVIMTKEAEHFITPLTLSSLAEEQVYQGMFREPNSAWEMPHIELAKGADVLLVSPATANIIGKVAHGIADDLISCVALATKSPILMAPAMNDEMYMNATVQENCSKLKSNGVKFIEPIEGKLACGTTGVGHIADEESIVKAVEEALK